MIGLNVPSASVLRSRFTGDLVSRLATHHSIRWIEGAVLVSADMVAVAITTAVIVRPSVLVVLATTLVAAICIAFFGGYRSRLHLNVLDDVPRLTKAVTVALVAMGVSTSLAEDLTGLVPLLLAGCLAVTIARSIALAAIRVLRRHLTLTSIMVGAGEVAVELHRVLQTHHEYGLRPIGVVDDVTPPDDIAHLGTIADLGAVVADHGVRRVIVAFGRYGEQRLLTTLRVAVAHDVDVYVVPRFFELGVEMAGQDVQTIWGIPVYRVRHPAETNIRWRSKRALDAFASACLLVILTPLIAAIAVMVRASSPGPVLFRQRRVGQHGRPIDVLKFRTMVVNDDSDTTWSVQDDPRVTPVGRWLRRLSLDELPQLWNVLRGDMSLVGPRPERPQFVETYSTAVAGYGDRHRLPVGLTGLAQVQGLRGDTSIAERARFDNLYIENWSPWQDTKILMRTGMAVARDALGPVGRTVGTTVGPGRRRPGGARREQFLRPGLITANLVLVALLATGHAGSALVLGVAAPVGIAIWRRPQLGLLVLLALVPFAGLLDVIPHPGLLAGWKEALVVITLAASFVAPPASRAGPGRRLPSWTVAAGGLFVVSMASALTAGGTGAVYGLKITFFYVLVAVAVWRCPPSPRERDHLVTVLFVTGLVTAVYGLAQQALGPVALNQLGYEYNTTIRFAGNHLRSFSTFSQPFGFAFYLMVVMLVCLAVSLEEPRRLRSRLVVMTTPVLFVAMLSTFVRGAWLGFAVGIAYLGFRRHRGLLLLIPLALVAVAVLPTNDASRAALSTTSSEQRVSGWSERTNQALTHPFGNGLGTTGAAAEKAQELSGVTDPSYYPPDNQYFLVLFELGILGLWCLLTLFTTVFTSLRRGERRLQGSDSALARGATAMVVAAAVASFTNSYLQIFPMDILWWALIAVVAAVEADRYRPPVVAAGPGPHWRRTRLATGPLARLRARTRARAPDQEDLISSSGSLLASRLVVALLGWAGTVLIVRTLSPGAWGQFSFIFGFLGLLSVLTDLGVGRVIITGLLDPKVDHGALAGTYVVLRLVMGLIGYVLAVAFVLVAGYPAVVVHGTLIAGLVLVLATPSHGLTTVFQAGQRLRVVAVAESVAQLAQLALTVAIVTVGGTLVWLTAPAVVFEIVSLHHKLRRLPGGVRMRYQVDWPVWRGLLREAVPLAVGTILASAFTRIDVVMLSRLDTFTATGIYGIAYKFADVAQFVAIALTTAALPALVRTRWSQPVTFHRTFAKAFTLSFLAGALILIEFVLFAGPVIDLLYGARYRVGAGAAKLVMVGEIAHFFSQLGFVTLVAVGRNRYYPLVAFGGLILNVGLNLWLIPARSYQGAAIATVITEVVVAGCLVVLTMRISGIRPLPLDSVVRGLGAAAAAATVGVVVGLVALWPIAAIVTAGAFVAVCHLGDVGGPGGLRGLLAMDPVDEELVGEPAR